MGTSQSTSDSLSYVDPDGRSCIMIRVDSCGVLKIDLKLFFIRQPYYTIVLWLLVFSGTTLDKRCKIFETIPSSVHWLHFIIIIYMSITLMSLSWYSVKIKFGLYLHKQTNRHYRYSRKTPLENYFNLMSCHAHPTNKNMSYVQYNIVFRRQAARMMSYYFRLFYS